MKKFTQEELTAYVYNETSASLSAAITSASEKDAAIKAELETLTQVKNQLTAMSFSPSEKTIDKVLMYARLSCCPN